MSRTSLQRGFSDPLLPPHTCKCRPRKRRTAAELLVFRFFWAVQLGVRSADRLTDLSLVLRLVSASTLWLGCCHQPGGSQALLQCRDQRKEESKQWLVICVSSWRQNKRLELWFWLLSLLGTCDLFFVHWRASEVQVARMADCIPPESWSPTPSSTKLSPNLLYLSHFKP